MQERKHSYLPKKREVKPEWKAYEAMLEEERSCSGKDKPGGAQQTIC